MAPSLAAMARGATWLERHITLDKRLCGSDQAASLNPAKLAFLVADVLIVESALSMAKGPRVIFPCEKKKRQTLQKTCL